MLIPVCGFSEGESVCDWINQSRESLRSFSAIYKKIGKKNLDHFPVTRQPAFLPKKSLNQRVPKILSSKPVSLSNMT